MSTKNKLKRGNRVWTFDLDADRKTYSIQKVGYVRTDRSALMIGKEMIVQVLDVSAEELSIPADRLFDTREDAVKALCECAKTIRYCMHLDLDNYTKRIANCWNSIDYCTDLIEKLQEDNHVSDKETK